MQIIVERENAKFLDSELTRAFYVCLSVCR